MNVLSLFDGLGGARIALDRAGLKVDKYYASEIDKYAIQIATKNYPDIIEIGDVTKLTDDFLKTLDIDLLIGGTPCLNFSMSGNRKGSATKDGVEVVTLEQYLQLKKEGFEFEGQSYLFWEFVRVLNIVKPKYFLVENVRLTKKWLPMFNEALGVEPIFINSALVSAQNRPRFYWTNIPNVTLPEDKGIVLADILEDIKSQSLIDKSVKPSVAKNIKEQHNNIIVSNKDFYTMKCTSGYQDNKVGLKKSPCLRAGNNSTYALQKGMTYRKLTPLECERLQTIPDNFTEGVSNTQRYKMIGNGFTIDVIAHILSNLKIKEV